MQILFVLTIRAQVADNGSRAFPRDAILTSRWYTYLCHLDESRPRATVHRITSSRNRSTAMPRYNEPVINAAIRATDASLTRLVSVFFCTPPFIHNSRRSVVQLTVAYFLEVTYNHENNKVIVV